MGRSKQFDEAEVLEKAMLTFWKHGYDKTTVRTLEASMGINQFSIYATFQSKEELYRRVLQTYRAKLDGAFLDQLRKPNCTIKEVEDFLNKFALQIKTKKIPNGCMMVQSTTHFDSFDHGMRRIVLSFFNMMKKLFVRALENSVQQGLLPHTTDIAQSSEYLLGIAQSISVYSKVKSHKAVKSYVAFAMNKLQY